MYLERSNVPSRPPVTGYYGDLHTDLIIDFKIIPDAATKFVSDKLNRKQISFGQFNRLGSEPKLPINFRFYITQRPKLFVQLARHRLRRGFCQGGSVFADRAYCANYRLLFLYNVNNLN
ncbi:hypothetical protein GWI33_018213 [Rhynchophorus ferrugineus]|uniref:Uncharacterized protein n=1 Tax=Rhynchophorus ferrugineus TaxID=354439 RepID=A0A834M8D0_RHYFE|nr:hypothetical protein GWI33_018213 [Rhynchophorus ferrugineus]